ncbi:MAG: hypothetical protein LBJ72_10725 [Dysgonamonadaceae bacterium]|nr:hypothetical protein [Dysgonamonadaceae bacterium]
MIINSKYSSLYLGEEKFWKAFFDRDVCFVQTFASGDEIRVQFRGYSENSTAKYKNQNGTETNLTVNMLYSDSITGLKLFEAAFTIHAIGEYKFTLTNGTESVLSFFSVKTQAELINTVLLNYTHRRNEYDTIFVQENGVRKTFNFRIEGGLYPGDKTQAVENETFRDQRFNPFQTASEVYQISILTIGTGKGVPQWVGNKINHIFNLSNILIDGISTARNESSVPDMIQVAGYHPLYVFKLNIEQSDDDIILGSQKTDVFYLTDNSGNMIVTNSGDNITVYH